jgi:pyruvate dehydrogenase E1 component alpha subunit
MAAHSVDGFDPIATWQVISDAVDEARTREGPVFVECLTYRLSGHTGATGYAYMPEDELSSARDRDPAPTFRAWLIKQGHLDEAAAGDLDDRAHQTVDEAFTFAKESDPPGLDEIYTDVLAADSGA